MVSGRAITARGGSRDREAPTHAPRPGPLRGTQFQLLHHGNILASAPPCSIRTTDRAGPLGSALAAAPRAPAGTQTPAAFPGHDRLHEPSSAAPARAGLSRHCRPGTHMRRHLPLAVGVLLVSLGCPSE